MLDRAPELSYARRRAGDDGGRAVAARPGDRRAEPRRGPSARLEVPRELPADLVTFVGRTRETAEVVGPCGGATAAAVVVTGPLGSGKTALAVRAAHAVASDFPDGQVFVDLGYRSSVSPGEVLARVLRALGVAPADVPRAPTSGPAGSGRWSPGAGCSLWSTGSPAPPRCDRCCRPGPARP